MKKLTLLFSLFLLFAGLVTAQEKNLPQFSGLMFGDYFYDAKANNGANNDLNGFQFRRIYITTDYAVDADFSARFRLESDQSANSNTAGGKLGVMVKDAWLKWSNIFSGSDLIFGLSPTPAFDVSETAWGHRYLEKTIMDLNSIVSSRDLGVDLKGKFDDGGTVKYWLKIGNNSSNGPETDKYKRFYGLLEFDPSANLLFTVYGDYASAANIYDKVDLTYRNNSAFVGALFLNYREKGSFSIGAEGFIKSQRDNYQVNATTSLATQNGDGISLWAYANLSETIQVVGRYDGYDPNTANSNLTSIRDAKSLVLIGLQFSPSKHTDITPNIEITHYQAPPTNGGYSQDVVPRVTFYWEF
ncbi:MAG: hypothetical protein ABR980_05505 [Ignavibacteriaceae bacterium]|jgi:hypothetical protein